MRGLDYIAGRESAARNRRRAEMRTKKQWRSFWVSGWGRAAHAHAARAVAAARLAVRMSAGIVERTYGPGAIT